MNFNVEDIDIGILPLVQLMNDNGFEPFASCDGMIEHHFDKWGNHDPYDVINAYVAILDSENTRNLFAILMDNDRFNLSISNPATYELYGNEVSGLRFAIHFDNYRGDGVKSLMNITKRVISGEAKPSCKNKMMINLIAGILSSEKIVDENLNVSFDIHTIYRRTNGESVKESYSIAISEKDWQKNMFDLPAMLDLDMDSKTVDLVMNGRCQFYFEDLKMAIEYLCGALFWYSKLGEYQYSDSILGCKCISADMERHADDMFEYLEEIYKRCIDKSVRRHYRKLEMK